MSGLLMGQVWELDLSKGQQTVLLALADHAHDDGSRVFPSVGRVAWKTGYQRRHVQRTMRELQGLGVLLEVAPATRRLPTEYRINLAAGKRKAPFVTRGDISDTEGRHDGASGASPRTPEPSVEPSVEPTPSIPRSSLNGSTDDVSRVEAFYIDTMPVRRKTLDADGRKIIAAALKVASADELLLCIRACFKSDWHMKRGDYANRQGGKHNAIGKILKPRARNGETQRSRVDWWLDLHATQAAERVSNPEQRAIAQMRAQGMYDEADEEEAALND